MKVYISAKKRLKGRTTKKGPPEYREAPFGFMLRSRVSGILPQLRLSQLQELCWPQLPWKVCR